VCVCVCVCLCVGVFMCAGISRIICLDIMFMDWVHENMLMILGQ
jgi:hypothetical protein